MNLITCGGLRIDYVITAENDVHLRQMGGNAIYSAVGARLWTDNVVIFSRIGENYPPEWLDELERRGFDLRGVIRAPSWQEMRTFYTYLDPQTRIDHDPEYHFARVGHPFPEDLQGYSTSIVGQEETAGKNPLSLEVEDIADLAASCAAAHIAPIGPLTQRDLVKGLRALGVPQVTVDPGEFEGTPENLALLREICTQMDAFLPSLLEIRLLFGHNDERAAAEELASWGVRLVLIKRGPRGSLLYDRHAGQFTEIPAYPTQVVDVTGAGDSFCGGFAVGLQQTGDPVRAALMGSVSASFVIEGYGALYALHASKQAVQQRLSQLEAMWRE